MIGRARERRRASGRPTILFLDEIHRFNKAQQDALLPAVEEGLLTLIGATTENPYFEVNSALLSRCQVYELQPLSPEQSDRLARMVRVAERAEEALGNPEKAARWLRKPNRALKQKRPIELLESDVGARMVERALGRIEHGVYS